MRNLRHGIVLGCFLVVLFGVSMRHLFPFYLVPKPNIETKPQSWGWQLRFVPKGKPPKHSRPAPSWTRWLRGRATIVSMRLDRVGAQLSYTPHPERCESTFRRFSSRLRMPVVVVTTSLFFNPRSSTKQPVGANILKGGKVTTRQHAKPRKFLVIPRTKPGLITIVDSWGQVVVNRHRVWAIELGPTIYPTLAGGLNEPNWDDRRTERYLLALRGNNEILAIYHPHASAKELWGLCRSLRVRVAAFLDGGSSIRDGSQHHVVFLEHLHPA